MPKKKTPDKIFKEKIAFLLSSERDTEKAVIAHQKKLFEILVSEYLPLFELEDGIIANTKANDLLISQIDKYFDRLEKALHRDVLGPFAKSLLESASISKEYYVALGFKKKIVNGLLRDKVRVESTLGITSSGKLRKNGYLFRLGKTEQVRQQLRDFVLNSITGDVSFLDFQLGFRNLVLGNKRVKGLNTDGSLQRYFDQFAYDSFNNVDALVNKQLATNLNLKHFIYEGSTIKTSRKFCIKRAGKAFRVSDTKKWKNDPDLIEKRTKESYKPLIERGRYRCRHFIKYITE